MIAWGKVPWPLWLYVALSVGQIFVGIFTSSLHVAVTVFFIVFILAWNFFLLRAVRWLWIATVVVGVLAIAINVASGTGTWLGDLIEAIGLGLLLLPATRRFFAPSGPATAVST